jgi:hypothetical protein
MPLTTRERFVRTLTFQPVDRLPVTEWAPWWWDQTLKRWQGEGLPAELFPSNYNDMDAHAAIRTHFGLDDHRVFWFRGIGPDAPMPTDHNRGPVTDLDSYQRLKTHFYPEVAHLRPMLQRWAKLQQDGAAAVWFYFEGFFWFPRTLFGIEEHLFAFADQPELMQVMNQDVLAYNQRVLDFVSDILRPDWVVLAEDMSYNKGPMLSKGMFDDFMAPYYRQWVNYARQHTDLLLVDSDGLVDEIVPWMLEVGMDGFLPLERMAGVDVAALRREHPRLRLMGGFDKRVMSRGEAAIRAEFERLLPVMHQGGYIPSTDHQTPPEVSLADYRLYVRLQQEYARQAAS